MIPELGQIAYEAYANHTGNKTFDGRDMPHWNDLNTSIQMAWNKAAEAARRYQTKP
jgi:hypothetical protein